MMNMTPYYKLDEETRNIIWKLYNTCKELKLGNVSFEYFHTIHLTGVRFFLKEYRDYWEVVINTEVVAGVHKINVTDVYKLTDDGLVYDYSEKD